MSYVIRRGLGDVPTFNNMGQLIPYCSGSWLDYLTASGCWNYSRDAWKQMAALPPIPNLTVPPAAIPSAFGTGPTSVQQADAESTAVLNEAWAKQHEAIREWGAGLPDDPIPDVPCTWLNIPCGYILGGLAAFAFVLLAKGGR